MNSYRILVFICAWFFVHVCVADDQENSLTANSVRTEAENANEPVIIVDADAGKQWNIFGIEIVGKIMSTQTNGEYAVVVSTAPPNGGPPLHFHERENELFFVVDGNYEFQCGEKKFIVSKGAIIHLPRKIPHRFRNIGEQPGVLMNTITPGGFENFFKEIDRLPKANPLDRSIVRSIASKYGLKFLTEDE